jgi:hypothetical protein
MSSNSKRKRPAKNPHAAQFEIVRATTAQSSAVSHTVTFDRHAGGRLGQQTDIAEIDISAEDLAILAQDPEYSSLPDDDIFNFAYFEQVVQNDDDESSREEPAKDKDKVKPVSIYSLFVSETTLNHIQNIYHDWLPFRDTHVHELARHDGWADLSKVCIRCSNAPSAYKCDECYGPAVYCRMCVLADHARLPLHRIKVYSIIIMIFVIC